MENEISPNPPVSLKLSDRQPETESETAAMLTAGQLDTLSLLRGSAEDLNELEDLGCVMSMADGSIERTGWGSTVLIEAGSLGLEDRDDLPELEDE